ncbi:DUF2934 domain-containing protein [Mesorhizobium shangrilense]|uniref:DUF2934 domain-containing protein n=1 Tax=Mesorhizobium shangrilense TaxID=460060 RepID=A0ABV2D6P1_9HYPH
MPRALPSAHPAITQMFRIVRLRAAFIRHTNGGTNHGRRTARKDPAYEIWEREGGVHGDQERHWHQAQAEIDREAALPLTADDALPETREIASADVLTVEELAARTGISDEQARELIDRLGSDRAAIEHAARQ